MPGHSIKRTHFVIQSIILYNNSYSTKYNFTQGVPIEEVVNSGPGLVFITYPEVVLKLPGGPIWAFTFFIMLVVSLSLLKDKQDLQNQCHSLC